MNELRICNVKSDFESVMQIFRVFQVIHEGPMKIYP